MTSPPVRDPNTGSPTPARLLSSAHEFEFELVSSVPVLRLQGVVMAVRGVTSTTAMSSLRRHSRFQGISVVELASQVMVSLEQCCTVITRQGLNALLAGHPSTWVRDADATRRRPDPESAAAPASLLHLIPTSAGADAATAAAGQRSTWQAQGLTRRESQVLALIGQGLSNREIAAMLFVTGNTVKSYIRNAYQKIGVVRRAQAVRWAIEHGAS